MIRKRSVAITYADPDHSEDEGRHITWDSKALNRARKKTAHRLAFMFCGFSLIVFFVGYACHGYFCFTMIHV